MDHMRIQFVLDEDGNSAAVIMPIELWRQIESDKETAYLRRSKHRRQLLLYAKKRRKGIPIEEVREKLKI